jgi:NAD(P)H-dependent FMN reductase
VKLGIVIGSIRQGRVTDRLAKWVANEAKETHGFETSIIDLKDFPMPLFDEAISPQFNPDRKAPKDVQVWLDAVAGCDAIALVTPEYNRSYSSVLKNALDYLDFQLQHKPVMLVAHGSTGGAQAVSHLRAVVPGVLGVSVPHALMVNGSVADVVDENGTVSEEVKSNPYGPAGSLKRALDDLVWYTEALNKARA